jgi:heme-degrading monooxygenase HmoA
MGDEAVRLMRQAPGFHYSLLLEAQDQAGLLTSVTVWDSQEEANAWYTSPEYGNLIKGLGAILASVPERRHYDVHGMAEKEPAGV